LKHALFKGCQAIKFCAHLIDASGERKSAIGPVAGWRPLGRIPATGVGCSVA
jgi:hypothetical protein